MKRTIVALSSLLAYGLAYGNDGLLVPSSTTEENINWNDTPVAIAANNTDQISFTKQNASLDSMAGAVTYKITEDGQDYSFTVKVNTTNDTATCEIANKQVGDENYAVWYTVESGNKQIVDEKYSCDITVTRHIKPAEPFNPNAHFFKGNSIENLMQNSISQIDVVEKNDQQYAAVANGNTLKLYKLTKNEVNELILQNGPNTVDTGAETINTVTHYKANNEVYLVVGMKSDSGNARAQVYSIGNDGSIIGNGSGPLFTIDLDSKTKIASIAPIVENSASSTGYFAIALQGDKQHGYVQQVKFYRFDMANNTSENINNDGNKVLGLNPQKLIFFNQDGKKHLIVVNKNNPAEYKVESQLLTFTIESNTIKITNSQPIETFGAVNALNFTSNGKNYIAFNESHADYSETPKSQIFSLEDSDVIDSLDFGNDIDGIPYQTLTYSLHDANMQQYDYLMYISSEGSILYQWDPAAQTVIPYSGSAPESNGATTANWEFVKKADNDYYLLAVRNQANSNADDNNKVIQTYQVTDR